ncbi:hypothetical protein [Deinococcus sp.]|uniref:hypothetical protein n=1 Tax=Deinococcus sp. TaxID=47478 RepID=UPI0025D6C5A4|nr:hypothetical protein [Deinococcus sp.]
MTPTEVLNTSKAEAALAASVTKKLAKQEQRIDVLTARVSDLANRPRSGGGFPWLIVAVAAGGYALLRSNPDLMDRVKGLLGQADPGVKGNLNRAGESIKDAVKDGLDGNYPRDSLKSAGGELKRAGEKTVDAAGDKLDDLKRDANRKLDDIKD